MISLCSQLTEIAPVCGVLGNHEDVKIYHQGDEELVKRFEDAGVKILRNEETSYSLYDNTVSVIGIEGKPEDFASYGAKECMEAQEAEDQYDLRICIAHVPTYFPEKLENYSFDPWTCRTYPRRNRACAEAGTPLFDGRRTAPGVRRGKLYACKQGDADCQPRTGRFQ